MVKRPVLQRMMDVIYEKPASAKLRKESGYRAALDKNRCRHNAGSGMGLLTDFILSGMLTHTIHPEKPNGMASLPETTNFRSDFQSTLAFPSIRI